MNLKRDCEFYVTYYLPFFRVRNFLFLADLLMLFMGLISFHLTLLFFAMNGNNWREMAVFLNEIETEWNFNKSWGKYDLRFRFSVLENLDFDIHDDFWENFQLGKGRRGQETREKWGSTDKSWNLSQIVPKPATDELTHHLSSFWNSAIA